MSFVPPLGQTLRRWEDAGKIVPEIRTDGGHRRYDYEKLKKVIRKFKKDGII